MIIALAFLITLTILFSAVAANRTLKINNVLLEGDLAEAEEDLEEAESDNTDLLRANLRLENQLFVYGASNVSLRRRVEAGDLAFSLLKAAGEDLLKSTDDYIDELEGDIDDVTTALGQSLALNELQDVAIGQAVADANYERSTADATIKHMLDTMVPVEELTTLTNAVAAYDTIADKFIDRVDAGRPDRARTNETYNELKAARGWNAGPSTESTAASNDAPTRSARDLNAEWPTGWRNAPSFDNELAAAEFRG